MLTDQKGNIVKLGTKLVVNLSSTCAEVEVVDIKEGGMVVFQDKKSGQQGISATEVTVKLVINAMPGQPLPSSWVIVEPPKKESFD